MFKNIPDEVLGVIYTYLHELKYCLDDIKIKGSQSRMNHITNRWLKNRQNNESEVTNLADLEFYIYQKLTPTLGSEGFSKDLRIVERIAKISWEMWGNGGRFANSKYENNIKRIVGDNKYQVYRYLGENLFKKL